ncbi:MAG TPA: M23 family metallopeptidase [Cyclobacteriaceae bacterium]|nr:M23 family metallopeptidase [Cyclobacteriaceae bacterium]
MAFSRIGTKWGLGWIVLLIIFIGSCAALPSFQKEEKILPAKSTDLTVYFKAPELPEKYYMPKKKESKKIRSKQVAKAAKPYRPLFMNPVMGASRSSIISLYGDARDGGKRKHEGIDIFAPKGTFIVAPSDGEITSVGYNSLGGKVIWMNDSKSKHSYYFAHLDSQIVVKGMLVKQGDTLGTVGNTGNARRTRSHLHFGVYNKNTKNPVTYIRSRDQFVSMTSVAASE